MRIRYRVHTPATVPQFDLVSRSCGEIDMQVALKGQGFDAVYLTVMSRHYLYLDIFVSGQGGLLLLSIFLVELGHSYFT